MKAAPNYRQFRQNTQLDHSLRNGIVRQRKEKERLLRIAYADDPRSGEVLTDWLPVFKIKTIGDAIIDGKKVKVEIESSLPLIGEKVMVFSQSGDPATGVVLGVIE